MEAIVINRKLANEEEKELLELLNNNDHPILFSNVELAPAFEKLEKGKYELTAEQKKEINYNIIGRIIAFGEHKINNIAISDMLTIEKVSIWHYHKFRIYFAIRNLFYEIELINQLISKYDKVIYYGESPFLKNYPFDFPNLRIYIPSIHKSGFSFKIAFKYAAFFKLRVFLGFFQPRQLKRKKHLVIDHAIKQTCLNLDTLKPEPGNYNLQYLFERLDKDFIILDEVEIPKLSSGSDFSFNSAQFKSGKKRIFGERILFSGLLSGKTRKSLKNASNQLLARYDQIISNIQDPLYKLVIQQIKILHASSKLFLFKYFAYKKFFTRYKFVSISSIDENSARIKSILDAAKYNNITTVGLQHGTIHELHPAYIYTKEDQLRNIVPDFTMVWGKYWSQFLIDNGNYHPNSLKVAGQIRTDIIPKLSSAETIDFLNVPENSRIVVFASQPQRDPRLREQAAFDVFSSMKKLKDVQLIVKLHPAEKNDIAYYKNIADKAGCSNYQIMLDIDLYLLISKSDIMITCFSTVGAETVYFNKPLIILDHLKQDIQGYYKEGIAFRATNKNELEDFLIKLLANEIKFDQPAYKNYIEKYAYRIDGKVAERIIDFIKNL